MKDETYPYRYDNCKDCIARCLHAGKDRKFVYHGFKSCKVVKEQPCFDRSAWKPCAECQSCDNCKNNSDYNPDEGIYGECGQCHKYSNFEPRGFCGECGRPLTDAAWEMLERRLAGR